MFQSLVGSVVYCGTRVVSSESEKSFMFQSLVGSVVYCGFKMTADVDLRIGFNP